MIHLGQTRHTTALFCSLPIIINYRSTSPCTGTSLAPLFRVAAGCLSVSCCSSACWCVLTGRLLLGQPQIRTTGRTRTCMYCWNLRATLLRVDIGNWDRAPCVWPVGHLLVQRWSNRSLTSTLVITHCVSSAAPAEEESKDRNEASIHRSSNSYVLDLTLAQASFTLIDLLRDLLPVLRV